MQQHNDRHVEQERQRLTGRFATLQAYAAAPKNEPSKAQQRIVSAALELLHEEGLEDLSLRKIASKLDMQAPALYWHFKNKEELITSMAEVILQIGLKDSTVVDPTMPWQEWLIQVCTRLRSSMVAYRDGARVVSSTHPYPSRTLLAIIESCQRSLVASGVAEPRASTVVTTAINYTLGRVLEEQSWRGEESKDGSKVDMQYISQTHPYVTRSTLRSIEALNNGRDEFADGLRLIVGAEL